MTCGGSEDIGSPTLSADAVQSGRVYAVDANACFARPGPRVVDGIELLAHLMHPDRVRLSSPRAFRKVACA